MMWCTWNLQIGGSRRTRITHVTSVADWKRISVNHLSHMKRKFVFIDSNWIGSNHSLPFPNVLTIHTHIAYEFKLTASITLAICFPFSWQSLFKYTNALQLKALNLVISFGSQYIALCGEVLICSKYIALLVSFPAIATLNPPPKSGFSHNCPC